MPERLIALARMRMTNGELSRSLPRQILGRLSDGATCAICLDPIQANKLEFEAEIEAGELRNFHPDCYAAWETAARRGFGTTT